MTKQYYELNDSQWEITAVFLNTERKRKLNLRDVVNAILYIDRTGCQWRNLPPNFPHWRAVNYYFERWKVDGTVLRINDYVNELDRIRESREAQPSLLCIDSQSVKLAPMIYEERGIDANKKVNGRKRQFLVDSGGRTMRVKVHPANVADGYGGIPLLGEMNTFDNRLEKIMGDASYNGVFAKKSAEKGIVFEKSSRAESAIGFVPEAKRWVVERTIAMTNFFRRVVKDYEHTTLSSETWLIFSNITIMLQRLSPNSI